MSSNVLITNSVILNGGDAAIVLSMAAALRRELGSGTAIRVLCHSVEAARRLYGSELDIAPALEEAHRAPGRSAAGLKLLGETLAPRLRLGLLDAGERRVDALFRWADVIVSCGGGFLTDRYSSGKRLAALRRALAGGRPLIFYAQSVGPFAKPASRRAFRSVLERAAAITVRDARSMDELDALGLAGRGRLTADEAFLFDAAPPLPIPDLRSGLAAGQPLVAISVRSWHFPGSPNPAALKEGYRAAMAAAAELLVRRAGARVLFLSTCQGVSEYGHDDSAVAERIAARLPAEVRPNVAVDRQWHHPAELREMLRQCDAVVATRMHAAILAMLGGTPALAIGYEAKSRELYSRLGLGEWCLDIAGPGTAVIGERTLALLDGRREMAAALPGLVAGLAETARENARAVRAVLDGLPGGRR